MANGRFGGGTGSADNPYLVEDMADLLALNNVAINDNKKHYLQTADIDLSEYTSGNFPTLRINVNSGSNNYGFTYDGGGYKILNLTQLLDGSSTADFGLFELYSTAYSNSHSRANAAQIVFKNINLINVNVSGKSGSPFMKPQRHHLTSTSSTHYGYGYSTDITFDNCFVSGKMSNITNESTSTSCFIPGKMYRYNSNHVNYIYTTIKGCAAVMQINIQSNENSSALPSFGGFIGETQYSTSGSYHMKIMEPAIINSCLHLDIHVENTGSAIMKIAGMVAGSCNDLSTSYVNISYDIINSGEGTTNCYYLTTDPSQTGSCIVNHEKGQLEQYAYDNLHYLTDEQMKDSSYYERLGWWI